MALRRLSLLHSWKGKRRFIISNAQQLLADGFVHATYIAQCQIGIPCDQVGTISLIVPINAFADVMLNFE